VLFRSASLRLCPLIFTMKSIDLSQNMQRQILCIEDNISNLTLVEEILKDESGIVLHSTKNGQNGLDFAREFLPEVILLDLHLPDISGWDILSQLKSDGRTKDIPVIVVSADATARQIARSMAAGAHAYLTKPIDVAEFLVAIETALTCPARCEQDVAA